MARYKLSLSDFASDMMFQLYGEDSYANNIHRAKVCNLALQGLQELNLDIGGSLKSVRIDVNQNTNSVDFPEDFMDYTKIGILDDNCKVQFLGRNDKINISGDFLLDSNNNKLLDSDGIELTAFTQCTPEQPNQGQGFQYPFYNYYQDGSFGQIYGSPTGNNSNGSYRVDYENGRIVFDDGLVKDSIILEYIADETMKANPLIPYEFLEAMRAYVYYHAIMYKRNVTASEKHLAYNSLKVERKRAARRHNSATVYEIIQAARTGSKQTVKF